jgi:hypothetical protein
VATETKTETERGSSPCYSSPLSFWPSRFAHFGVIAAVIEQRDEVSLCAIQGDR